MMSPMRRHPMYAHRPGPPPQYYYEPTAYPGQPLMGAYYPSGPSGIPYYDPAAKYHSYGRHSGYPGYMNDEFGYGQPMVPYGHPMGHPYDGSPSHYMMPVTMRSPHHIHHQQLSVHKSASKSKR